jgi:hypothetical protein
MDYGVCYSAALHGHFDVLKWAVANGCAWEKETCDAAAYGGHLAIVKWARANGASWGESTCHEAAKGGELGVLTYLRANGCPWDELTCAGAAQNGHLDVLKWARSRGCPWDKDACAVLAIEQPFTLNWILKKPNRRRRHDRGHEAVGEALPELPLDIVTSHVLKTEYLSDPGGPRGASRGEQGRARRGGRVGS